MKKSILITGAAGFIGYHSALALKKRGDQVIGLDHFSDYYDRSLKYFRRTLLEKKKIPVFSADICHTQFLETCLRDYGITHVLHLAAQAGVRASLSNPEPYVHSNLTGFVSVLEAIKRFPKISLIYASSSSVYGNNAKRPFAEKDPVEKPANLYAATKRCAEVLAASYHELYGIPVCGLRYFTVYGPLGRPDMAYYLFSQNILQKKTITLYGEGKMERDFTYIDDIVAGTILALDQNRGCAIYNLSSGLPLPIAYLVERLEKGLGQTGEKRALPPPQGEVPITYGCIKKARLELGYQPQTSFEKGVSLFTDWIRGYGSYSLPGNNS